MSFKALRSFTGVVSMKKGDVKEIKNEAIVNDLLKVGYIERVGEAENKPARARRKKEAIETAPEKEAIENAD